MTAQVSNSPDRSSRVLASPRARCLLQQLGLDPRQVSGSGPLGRIVEADVKAVLANPAGQSSLTAVGGVSAMRRAIAEKTALSFATIPHFYLRVEADVTSLMDLRSQLAPAIEREAGAKPTITDFLLCAMARAVVEFPFANCIWRSDTLVELPTVDLGVVVGLENGLLIPILRSADKLDLAELARRRSDLVAAARAGKLTAADTQGGAMSLSNLGNSPVDEFAAVIAPTQSGMLSVGRAAPRPFVIGDQLAVRTTLKLCLAGDHRVMDGGPAGKMLGRIAHLLEHPAMLIRQSS
jgi:pyruvate dehydrogenase E2 component (dihydrolipoamide acetyltransferase)